MIKKMKLSTHYLLFLPTQNVSLLFSVLIDYTFSFFVYIFAFCIKMLKHKLSKIEYLHAFFKTVDQNLMLHIN